MATVKINGKEITVPDGTSILDAARQAGFEIPTFCFLSDLSPLGSCRMCLVEITGQRKMQPSCVTPVLHGMEVLTETDTVKSARSSMLDFLLANHPLDCPICDKGGECELQDLTFKYGPRHSPFSEWKRRFHEKDEVLSPVIVKNHNRCIHCERCVRVCAEVVGANALGGIGRGHKIKETSFMNAALDCDQCGNCVEVCPVGSFMNLPYRYKARPWDLNETDTICPYCATGCQLTVGSRNGEIVRVRSKFDAGFNREWLCALGRYGHQFVQSEKRLTKPLIKKNGALVECSWEEALSVIKQRFGSGERVAGIASAELTNEELYAFQKLMRNVFRTNNIDSDSRWIDKTTTSAMIDVCNNIAGDGVSISDAMKADLMFVIASSISDENPITDYFIRTAATDRRKTLILAYPRQIKLNSSAGLSIKYRPGSEGMVVSGIMNAIGKEGGKAVANLAHAGISEQDIVMAAQKIKAAQNISIFVGTDILRFDSGRYALHEMADMTREIRGLGKKVNVMPLLDRCNQKGAWDMGAHPLFLPGYKTDADKAGMDCKEILEASANGEMDAIYIAGEDVVSLYPDARFAKDALSKAGFVVVQDIFLTETAKMADVVLPGASFAEKEGTYTNQEGRVQRIRKAVKVAGASREDWRIFCDIGKMSDRGFGYNSPEEIFNEMKTQVSLYQNVAYAGINHLGVLIKAESRNQQSAIRNPESQIQNPKSDSEHPFLLMTGNHLFHSGILSQKAAVLRQLLSEPFVEISGSDAAAMGIKDGDTVKVGNRYNEALLRVKVKEGSLSGVVFIAENFEDMPVNLFFKKGEGIPRVKIVKGGVL